MAAVTGTRSSLIAVRGILSWGVHLPYRRLDRSTIAAVAGTGGGKGTRTVASYDAETTSAESCEKATELTALLWPFRVWRQVPVVTSQILTVLSSEAEASHSESCEKDTENIKLLWPLSV